MLLHFKMVKYFEIEKNCNISEWENVNAPMVSTLRAPLSVALEL